MTAVCETLGVARSNIARRVMQGPSKRRGRPALSEEPLLSEIMTVIAEMPSYGYRGYGQCCVAGPKPRVTRLRTASVSIGS